MRALDIDAEILPGHSAGGFELGMNVAELREIVSDATVHTSFPANDELRTNFGAIVVRDSGGKVEAIVFGEDQVRLVFNAKGNLFCIFVFEGYRGTYQKTIRVGSPLKHANELHRLLFDDGDEMNYVEDESGDIVPGIAFCGTSCSLERDPEQPISGFCVHDWSQK